MIWLQENGTTLLMMVVMLVFVLRGPLMARLYKVESITVHDLAKRLASKTPPLLLDVRTPSEYAAGHASPAIPIPLSQLSNQLEELKNKMPPGGLAVICQSGSRSLSGSVTLKRAGFETVFNVSGGMGHWRLQGYPVQK